jgi:hypothetical protein
VCGNLIVKGRIASPRQGGIRDDNFLYRNLC